MYFHTLALAALSIGSAFSAPTTVAGSDPKILTSAISAVADTKTAVDNQVAITKNLVLNTVNNEVVPALKASLNNIATEINNVVQFVTPLVTNVILPLAEQEFNNIPGFVANVKSISADVEVTVNLILANLPQDLLILVKSEVQLVLDAVYPFARPVILFANSAITGTSGSVTVAITATVVSIQDSVARIQGPLTDAVSKID
ncbi:hypothetical protein F4782DRAFT_528890 [Xylaria castorea]|nr:hypothetical protein F4782DRAFT_528890 [Xylaria castorea]